MGKKMKLLPFLSHSKSLDSHLNSWPFPSCANIKTLSFRNPTNNFCKDDNFTTFNSAFIDHIAPAPHSFTTPSSSSTSSFSTMSDANLALSDPIDDSVLRGFRSDRLFFEPQHSCSLILQQQQQQQQQQPPQVDENVWVEESEAMCLESNNPCEDFLRSMEEMVEARGLKDWEGLEELLGRYLKINAQTNHAYIMAAFIDLLLNLSFISSSASTTTTHTTNHYSSPSSPLSLPSSSLNTTSLSSLFDHGDDHHCNDDHGDENADI